MKQQIRHPDLSKLSDTALQKEADYLHSQCQRALDLIGSTLNLMRYGVKNITVPAWRLEEDLRLHSERYEAVIEEINYRYIP